MAVDVSFVTSGHDVADARLHRLVRACRRAGLTVEVLGLGDPASAPEGVSVYAVPRPSVRRRAALAVRMARRASGRVLVALDPDSLVACTLVVRLPGHGAARARRTVVADVHENYADLLRDRAWARGLLGRAAHGVTAVAAALARRSDLTLVADDHVEPVEAADRLVVRNEPDLGLLGEPVEPDREPRAVYVGDVRTSRGLPDMVDAVAALPRWTLDIVGPVAAADETWLAGRLTEPALAGRVRLHGRRPPGAAWDIARGAWVGFALLHDTPAFRDAVPSKVYEYLALGIVPVVSDLPRQRELVERAASGFVCASGAEVAATLAALAGDPARLAEHRAAAARWRADIASRASAYDLAAERIARLARR